MSFFVEVVDRCRCSVTGSGSRVRRLVHRWARLRAHDRLGAVDRGLRRLLAQDRPPGFSGPQGLSSIEILPDGHLWFALTPTAGAKSVTVLRGDSSGGPWFRSQIPLGAQRIPRPGYAKAGTSLSFVNRHDGWLLVSSLVGSDASIVIYRSTDAETAGPYSRSGPQAKRGSRHSQRHPPARPTSCSTPSAPGALDHLDQRRQHRWRISLHRHHQHTERLTPSAHGRRRRPPLDHRQLERMQDLQNRLLVQQRSVRLHRRWQDLAPADASRLIPLRAVDGCWVYFVRFTLRPNREPDSTVV